MQPSQNFGPGAAASAELPSPSFRFLQSLAEDLSAKKIAFPTFVNATMNVRRVLNDPNVDANRLARTISAEPFLAAKVVHAANSVALRPAGKPVGDVRGAVLRVGHATVHSLAVAVAMAQLVAMKELRPFMRYAEAVWLHSLDVAAIAHLLSRQTSTVSPDEALFAGLVHDIGRFYLLSKVPKFPELAGHRAEIDMLLDEWHAPIGHAVLASLDLPEALLKAVQDHESDTYAVPPKTLADVVNIANRVSRFPNPLNGNLPSLDARAGFEHPEIFELLDDSADELKSLVAAFKA